MTDSIASQAYSNIRHGSSRTPPAEGDSVETIVERVFVDSSGNLEEDYAALCAKCGHLAASPDSCHLPPIASSDRKAYFECFCSVPDSTAIDRAELDKLAISEGWIIYLDDDHMFTSPVSLSYLMATISTKDQLVVFRSNSTSRSQELNYGKKTIGRGEMEGMGFMFHSSKLELIEWKDKERCQISRNFAKLSNSLRIKWIDLVPTIQHPLARHRPQIHPNDFRITVILFESLENSLWLEEVVFGLLERSFATLIEEIVVISKDREPDSFSDLVRIVNIDAGAGLAKLGGLSTTSGVLILRDSIQPNKVS